MQQVLQSVNQVSAMLGEVRTAAQQQQAGVEQVNTAVAHMDGITQQNAAMVEELAASAQALDGQVDYVSNALRLFRLRSGEPSIAETNAVELRSAAKAQAVGHFDFKAAIAKHLEWKTTLRNAALRSEQLDATKIARDDCCPLGQWLHGDGERHWHHRPQFTELLQRHAGFHRAAGQVAQAVNQGQVDQAQRLMHNGSAFADATQGVVGGDQGAAGGDAPARLNGTWEPVGPGSRRLQTDHSGPFFPAFLAHSRAMGLRIRQKTVLAGAGFRFRRPKSGRLLGGAGGLPILVDRRRANRRSAP